MSKATTIDGIDYGPLAGLVGVWKGDRGTDVAPEPDGEETTPFHETITFEAAGDVTNAERQSLAIVRYHQVVQRKVNDTVFHDQIGYWLWDSSDGTVVECFTIPRGVGVVAGGNAAAPASPEEEVVLEVSAKAGDAEFGIAQSAFMEANAKTVAFTHRVTLKGDELSYSETTLLDIYGRTGYEHTDANTLARSS